jgi:hypothetical protein
MHCCGLQMVGDFVLRLTNLVLLIVDHDVVMMLLLVGGGSHLDKRRKNLDGCTSGQWRTQEFFRGGGGLRQEFFFGS